MVGSNIGREYEKTPPLAGAKRRGRNREEADDYAECSARMNMI
jgi:hypothetical protein